MKNLEEKINYIKTQGFLINNEEDIKAYLEKICLFKLKKYFRNFNKDNTEDFQEVINHYLFDKELRKLSLEILEHLENSLKVQMVKVIGKDYLNENIFKEKYKKNRIKFIKEKLEYFRKRYGYKAVRCKQRNFL
ncbi:MAG: Abi family protein [Candidatus Gracilibacteria bacterium]|nr:Abi family protein [Candidatus Gracilibacteria bacterium]